MSLIPEREGLQPERTALAWQRSALTSLVLLLPLIVVDTRIGAWGLAGGGSVAAIVAAGVVYRVRHRFLQLHDDTRGYSPFRPMVQVAGVTVFGALGGVVTALWIYL